MHNLPIVFLHGFMGSPEDWEEILSFLPNFECICLKDYQKRDLPQKFHLVGYSMGGRIAMKWSQEIPSRIATLHLLSAHPGLRFDDEKKARLRQDTIVAESLLKLSIDEFLLRWYDLPLFKSLQKRNDLLQKVISMRKNNDPSQLAETFLKYSLAHQPSYWNLLPKDSLIIVGEHDEKYRALLKPLSPCVIPNAGHAVHLENPQKTAKAIEDRIKHAI